MHRALEIQEIVSSIFHHFTSDPDLYYFDQPDPTLVALARTCRAFKEPALDALWMYLPDLSPLLCCLPKQSYRLRIFNRHFFKKRRPLTQADWQTFRSYTRRIRYIHNFHWIYLQEFFTLGSDPPTMEPLFQNLRYLQCQYDEITMPLLNLPLPSLTTLHITFANSRVFRASLESFPRSLPNIRDLTIRIEDDSGDIAHNYICHFRNLHSVQVFTVLMDTDDLIHLSRMPMLTRLTFQLGEIPLNFDSPPSLSSLQLLELSSISLCPISRVLSQIRLPALTKLHVCVTERPSRQELAAFLTGILASNEDHIIQEFELLQRHPSPDSNHVRHSEVLPFYMENFRPYMVFGDLRRIDLDIECSVCLLDSDMLTLASAWPKLQELQINAFWGWNSQFGITPSGLARVLETCPSLTSVALRLDTRGFTTSEVFPIQAPDGRGSTLPRKLTWINVVDTAIDAESVPAVTAFIYSISACSHPLVYWSSPPMRQLHNAEEYAARWYDVRDRVFDLMTYAFRRQEPSLNSLPAHTI